MNQHADAVSRHPDGQPVPEEFSNVSIDDVRRYWDARPCNIRHSPKAVGSREYFDEVEARKYFVEPHIPGFAEFPKWKGKRVLEIGCGIGTDTMQFARAGAEVTAVDLSEESLNLARQRAQIYGLDDRIEFHQANAEKLSDVIEPQRFDLVYSFGVIHHTPHPARVVQQVRDHFLDAGGTFKLMVYHRRSWKVLATVLGEGKGRFWDLDEIVARHSEAQTGSPVTYTYTKSGVRDLLGDGFDVQELDVEHIFPFRVRDYVNYRYRKKWLFRALPNPVFHWLERRLGWHLCVTAEAT